MSDANIDLDCMIYVDHEGECDELASRLAQPLGVAVARGHVIELPSATLNVRANEDFDARERMEFPDGFQFFRCYIEVSAADGASLDDVAPIVGAALESCWVQQVPAVAACTYEDRLPRGGGYKDRDLP